MSTRPPSGNRPRDRWAPALAWSSCALGVASAALALIFQALGQVAPTPGYSSPVRYTVDSVLAALAVLTFSTVGALIASRRAENPIGWICCAMGLFRAADYFAYHYAIHTLLAEPGSLPGGEAMAWFANWAYVPEIGLAGFLFLLFPTGRLPSRRWRPIVWLGVIGTVSFWAATAFAPGPLGDFPYVTNPFGVGWAAGLVLLVLGIFGMLLMGAFLLASAASLILRFRHSRGEERQQLKWFASAAVVLVVGLVVWSPSTAILFGLGFVGLPIAVGIAILKYRLYDIDIIIRRTLVYSVLTSLLALAYFSSVFALQSLFTAISGQQSPVALVLSTLAIAALSVPLRRRVQDAIDRRFYRRKYDAAKVLAEFAATVRDETDLDKLTERLMAVVQETMQPAHVSLWLKKTEPLKHREH